MTRAELVGVVARAIMNAPKSKQGSATLTALCAALRIPPVALDALAAGEAVVVPSRGGITAQMEIAGGNVLDFKAVEAMAREEFHPDDAARRIYRAMVAASPYASAVKA